ncbi:glycosyltransferase family 2 protein [Methylobacterium pseudosasicola]|uniref:Glycosyltransferase involved in cell wall bisynthesis n=1 Tax=Methylobacterium pseudosasicola TaxID=582667 RepID=A0A1I4NNM8_9HYPH|nr:glycosyltransferase family 2 protein [Methylobacterium pseudosasicola]SFM16917.1 Glycosyltransferase involved in cell wall bisynthesis [Methylobacterium pseudosasicola]
MLSAPILLSLVVPVFNEATAIEPFLVRAGAAIEAACRRVGPGTLYEIVFVDDGSTDATLRVLSAARQRNTAIDIVGLSRNFGKDAALAAGLRHARGHAVIPIDVDLQDPPEIIVDMVSHWLAGALIVNGVRSHRRADSPLKRLTAWGFYELYNRFADQVIPSNVGDFRLIDRRIVDILNTLPERSRFTKGLFSWVGFRQAEVSFVREQRQQGMTKWRYWHLWNFALDGLTGSTTAPLRIWTYIGLTVAGLAFLYGLFLVGLTAFAGNSVPGYPSLMVAILFFGGLNLISIGIMGEYVGRIAAEVRGRPLYLVRDINGELLRPIDQDTAWTRSPTAEWPTTSSGIGGFPGDAPSSQRSYAAN